MDASLAHLRMKRNEKGIDELMKGIDMRG